MGYLSLFRLGRALKRGEVLSEAQRGDVAMLEASRTPVQFIDGTALSRIEANVGALVRQQQQQNENQHALNVALGEFREKLVQPLREELKYLRYNLGARTEQSVREIELLTHHFNKAFPMLLKASGMSDAQIASFRESHGLNSTEAPRAAELNTYIEQVQDLREQLEKSKRQNRRLLARLDTRHVFVPSDCDEWVYHPDCKCSQCVLRSEELDVLAPALEAAS